MPSFTEIKERLKQVFHKDVKKGPDPAPEVTFIDIILSERDSAHPTAAIQSTGRAGGGKGGRTSLGRGDACAQRAPSRGSWCKEEMRGVLGAGDCMVWFP